MDKVEYLNRREAARRRAEESSPRAHCFRCRRPRLRCLCHAVESFATPMDWLFLMHVKEHRNVRTGTGWLAHMSLSDSELLVGHRFEEDPRLHALLADPTRQPLLLFPGEDAWNLSERGAEGLVDPARRPMVILVDGTWLQARKIVFHSPALQALPRIAIRQAAPSRFTIKRQPAPACLSTIEACHAVLRDWNGEGGEAASPHLGRLLDLLAAVVDFQERCAREIANSRHLPRRKARPS